MERTQSAVTPDRFASGMTFAQYLEFIATLSALHERLTVSSLG